MLTLYIPESDSEAPQLKPDDNSRIMRVEQQSRVAEPARVVQVYPPLDGYPHPAFPFKILHPPFFQGNQCNRPFISGRNIQRAQIAVVEIVLAKLYIREMHFKFYAIVSC